MFGSGRHHYLVRLNIFLVIIALIAGMAGCDGDSSQNLEIRTWYDLDAVRDNLSGSHTLMNNLDSTTPGYEELASPTANGGRGWEPIGPLDEDQLFTGSFDGQGYEIRDLFINRPDDYGVGLFSVVDDGGVVQNIGVVNVTVTGETCVGGLVGENKGAVSNFYSIGSVTGNDCVGGLVGRNDNGTVSNSYSSGNVSGIHWAVGGLVGLNGHATVSDSYSTGSITGEYMAGGLVGENHGGTVSNSHSTGDVTGSEFVGGLMGENYGGFVTSSYSTGNVTGDECVGGLIGFNAGTLSNSYFNYDEVLVNGENIITIGALFDEDFSEWLANGKFLDVNERLSQEDGYYVVNNVTDFKQLLAFGQKETLKFRLKNDLDLATEPNFYIPYLAGEFDGNGHKISNLSFNFDFVPSVGLFGCLVPDGKITDLGVENINVTGSMYVGGLLGIKYKSTVSNCYSSGNVTGYYSVGGLVGQNVFDTVNNAYSTCSVTGDENVGGLVGSNSGWWEDNQYYGTVINSYSTGSVTGEYMAGGLVGHGWDTWVERDSFWDTETSGQATSGAGTGKTTAEMQDIATFSGAGWNIITVADPGTRNPAYVWNIVDDAIYPFLSWQP